MWEITSRTLKKSQWGFQVCLTHRCHLHATYLLRIMSLSCKCNYTVTLVFFKACELLNVWRELCFLDKKQEDFHKIIEDLSGGRGQSVSYPDIFLSLCPGTGSHANKADGFVAPLISSLSCELLSNVIHQWVLWTSVQIMSRTMWKWNNESLLSLWCSHNSIQSLTVSCFLGSLEHVRSNLLPITAPESWPSRFTI